MTLEEIANAVADVELRSGDPDVEITAVCYDSRQVTPGSLFVALRGESFDGHDFLDAAVEAGAAAILIERGHACELAIPILEVGDTRRILGPLASRFFGEPSRELTVVGITGTNGKTSSSHLLESILKQSELVPGVIGTIEYRWCDKHISAANTTPDGLVLQQTLDAMVTDGVDVAVIEVSSHGLENGRVDQTSFDLALFTNLTRDHVDFHGSMQAYRQAKWRLFKEYLPASGDVSKTPPVAIINTDGEEGQKLARALVDRNEVTVASFSIGGEPVDGVEYHFRGLQLDLSLEGIKMVVSESSADDFEISASMPGRFNAENMLGVVAAARMLGIDRDAIIGGLASADAVPGRMQRVEQDLVGPAVFVDYAHSPDALEQVLRTLSPLATGQLWVIFGCGGDRDRSKRAPMGQVAVMGADQVVITSDNPRREDPEQIIDEIVAGIEDCGPREGTRAASWRREIDRRRAIFDAVLQAATQDVILIAGKGHETTQESNGRRRQFDDRVVAGQALRRRGETACDG